MFTIAQGVWLTYVATSVPVGGVPLPVSTRQQLLDATTSFCFLLLVVAIFTLLMAIWVNNRVNRLGLKTPNYILIPRTEKKNYRYTPIPNNMV
jgi:hypothetical protein